MLRWAHSSSSNFHIPFWMQSGMLDKKQKLQPVIHALLLGMHIRAIFSSGSCEVLTKSLSACKFTFSNPWHNWDTGSRAHSKVAKDDLVKIPSYTLSRDQLETSPEVLVTIRYIYEKQLNMSSSKVCLAYMLEVSWAIISCILLRKTTYRLLKAGA